jgi:hypothetical protein
MQKELALTLARRHLLQCCHKAVLPHPCAALNGPQNREPASVDSCLPLSPGVKLNRSGLNKRSPPVLDLSWRWPSSEYRRPHSGKFYLNFERNPRRQFR